MGTGNDRPRHRRHQSGKGKGRSVTPSLSHLPPLQVTIDRLGARGDGLAVIIDEASEVNDQTDARNQRLFVPNALPGERMIVQPRRQWPHGIEAKIIEIQSPSPHRKAPDCEVSSTCGGCQFQHIEMGYYQDWKEQQVADFLEMAGIIPQKWLPPFRAMPQSRRRARLAWQTRKQKLAIGFRGRHSHDISPLTGCVILHPQIMQGYHLIRDELLPLLASHHGKDKTGEVEINLCDNGLDVVLRLDAPLSRAEMTKLIAATGSVGNPLIARLSLVLNNGEPELVFQHDTPVMAWPMPDGASRDHLTFAPPAGGFMQSVAEAETIMRQDCFNALKGSNKVVDLFSGAGSLGLALAFASPAPKQIAAYDISASAISALQAMIRSAAPDLPLHLIAKARNLFSDPLSLSELKPFDGAIIDPPRSGAGRQMPLLAASGIKRLVMVSCDMKSFARDAEMLISAGYQCRWARHIDQFLLTSHSELVAYFEK